MSRTVYRKSSARSGATSYHADPTCYVLTRHDQRINRTGKKKRKVKSHTEEFAALHWKPCQRCC